MKRNGLFGKFKFKEMGVLLALLALVLVFWATTEMFFTWDNLLNITRQSSVIALVSIAMTLVILTGGIDLSVGSVVAFSGIITASLIKDHNIGIFPAILAGILVGSLTGLVNGLLIAYVNMPPFITTMGTMTMLRGLGFLYTQGYPVYGMPKNFTFIGQGYLAGIPVPTVILIIVAPLAGILLTKTIFGRYIYAVGGSEEASVFVGIKVRKVKLIVYILAGSLTGLAAVIQTARLGAGMPTVGNGYELDAIASVIIGGASMSGGAGTIFGTLLGTAILGVLNNGLSLLDVDSYVMQVISGAVVILAVLIDTLRVRTGNYMSIKRIMQRSKQ